MMISGASFLVQAFHDFYEEILRLKAKALRASDQDDVEEQIAHNLLGEGEDGETSLQSDDDNITQALEKKEDDGGAQKSLTPANQPVPANGSQGQQSTINPADASAMLFQNIQRRLRIFLEEIALQASYQLGEYAQTNFKEAHYIMAAMADEVFLNLNWPGRVMWRKNLMESQLFQSQTAGELLFERLDKLLEIADPSRVDLAMVYLEAISLGFRGKYRGQDSDPKIDFYKKQLFHFINRRDSDLYSPGRRTLINAPYDYNISLPPSKGLPDVRSWVLTFFGVAITYLFVTYILWYRVVSDLNEALEYILEQAKAMPL